MVKKDALLRRANIKKVFLIGNVIQGSSKKTGITVNGHNGPDLAVYQYLWLADMSKPICPFNSYKNGHIGCGYIG